MGPRGTITIQYITNIYYKTEIRGPVVALKPQRPSKNKKEKERRRGRETSQNRRRWFQVSPYVQRETIFGPSAQPPWSEAASGDARPPGGFPERVLVPVLRHCPHPWPSGRQGVLCLHIKLVREHNGSPWHGLCKGPGVASACLRPARTRVELAKGGGRERRPGAGSGREGLCRRQ